MLIKVGLVLLILGIITCTPETKKFRRIAINLDQNPSRQAVDDLLALDLSKVADRDFCKSINSVYTGLNHFDMDQRLKSRKLFDIGVEMFEKCGKSRTHTTVALYLLENALTFVSLEERRKAWSRIQKIKEVPPSELTLVHSVVIGGKGITRKVVADHVVTDQPCGSFDIALKDGDVDGMLKSLRQMKTFMSETIEYEQRFVAYLVFALLSSATSNDQVCLEMQELAVGRNLANEWIRLIRLFCSDSFKTGYDMLIENIKSKDSYDSIPWSLLRLFFPRVMLFSNADEATSAVRQLSDLECANFRDKFHPVLNYISCRNIMKTEHIGIVAREFLVPHYEKCKPALELLEPGLLDSLVQGLQPINPSTNQDVSSKNLVICQYLLDDSLKTLKNVDAGKTLIPIEAAFLLSLFNQDLTPLQSLYAALATNNQRSYRDDTLIVSVLIDILKKDYFEDEPWLLRPFHGKYSKCPGVDNILSKLDGMPDLKKLKLFLLYYIQRDGVRQYYERWLSKISSDWHSTIYELQNILDANSLDGGNLQSNAFDFVPKEYRTYINLFLNLPVEDGEDFQHLRKTHKDSILVVYYWFKYVNQEANVKTEDGSLIESITKCIGDWCYPKRNLPQKNAELIAHAVHLLHRSKVKFIKFQSEIVYIVNSILKFDPTLAMELYNLCPQDILSKSDVHQVLVSTDSNMQFVMGELHQEKNAKLLKQVILTRKDWISTDFVKNAKSPSFQTILRIAFPEILEKNLSEEYGNAYYEYGPTKLPSNKIVRPEIKEEQVKVSHKQAAELKPWIVKVYDSELSDETLLTFIRNNKDDFNHLTIPMKSIKLAGTSFGIYRFRKGDDRIIFVMGKEEDETAIVILGRDTRGSVYEDIRKWERMSLDIDQFVRIE